MKMRNILLGLQEVYEISEESLFGNFISNEEIIELNSEIYFNRFFKKTTNLDIKTLKLILQWSINKEIITETHAQFVSYLISTLNTECYHIIEMIKKNFDTMELIKSNNYQSSNVATSNGNSRSLTNSSPHNELNIVNQAGIIQNANAISENFDENVSNSANSVSGFKDSILAEMNRLDSELKTLEQLLFSKIQKCFSQIY